MRMLDLTFDGIISLMAISTETEKKLSIKETKAWILDRIEMVRELVEDSSPVIRGLATIEGGQATLAYQRRKNESGVIGRVFTGEDTFNKALSEVMGGGREMGEEFSPSWIIRTNEGTRGIFPSWKFTKEEENCRVFFINSSSVSILEGRVTSTEWSVVASRPPEGFQFLRGLFR